MQAPIAVLRPFPIPFRSLQDEATLLFLSPDPRTPFPDSRTPLSRFSYPLFLGTSFPYDPIRSPPAGFSVMPQCPCTVDASEQDNKTERQPRKLKLPQMPADIRNLLKKLLANWPGQDSDAGEFSCRSVGGGSINSAFQILTKPNNRWFGKFNNAELFPGLFRKESNGLALLRQLGPIRIPATILCTVTEGIQVLLLEWIDEGLRTVDFWRRFGQQLALQHQVSQATVAVTPSVPPSAPIFGLGEDNYMGALPQNNTPTSTWVEFFIQHRLEPQIRLATDAGLLDNSALGHFRRLYPRLPDFFPPEPPSLLHGDLWSGNFLCDTAGQPVLIDPAVYFGHRNMDLAMTTLFGGFEPAFYEAYNDIYPFPKNYAQQWEIANLYPLLIHLNLFGSRPSPDLLRHGQNFTRTSFLVRPRSYPSDALGYGRNILHTIRRF